MALVAVGHPFDTLKVRLQTDGKGRFTGPLHCLVDTVKKEGVLALYKGVTPPLFATGVINAVLFGLQGLVLHQIKGLNDGDTSRVASVEETMVAAVINGALITWLVAPMEGVKSRLQVQYNGRASNVAPLYSGPIDCARKVTASLGLRGLYRGWAPVAICRMSNWSYFGSYAYFRQLLSPSPATSNGVKSAAAPPSASTAVLSGGMAGICYWMSCYPVDVIKARIQTQPDTIPARYPSMASAARHIYSTEGARGFFRGVTPCLLRAFPANAAAFGAFEAAMAALPA